MYRNSIRVKRLAPVMLALFVFALLLAACGEKESAASVPNAPAPDNPAGENAQVDATPANLSPDGVPMAASVNGTPIPQSVFERERDRRLAGVDAEPATLAAFEEMVLQSLIDERLIAQAAESAGIVVTDVEIDNELAIQGELAAANNTALEEVLAAQQYTMDEYREITRQMLLWNKVSQMVTANVPTVAIQVHSRHILVKDEALARDLLAQIQSGAASFEALAQQYSLDVTSAHNGGDLDWVGRGDLLQPEVEAAIFALQPGEIAPEPVHSSLGYHIVQTLERADGRELDAAGLAQQKEQAFLDWLDQQRAAADIQRFVATGTQ